MSPEQNARFEREFAPRLAERIMSLYRKGEVSVDIVPRRGPALPTRIEVSGVTSEVGLPHRLNVYLAWSDDAIVALLAEADTARFDRYLAALPVTIERWQRELPVDFGTRTQRDPVVMIGDLDFDA
jgi:hypothetical protein